MSEIHGLNLLWTRSQPLSLWLQQLLDTAIQDEIDEVIDEAIDGGAIAEVDRDNLATDYRIEDGELVVDIYEVIGPSSEEMRDGDEEADRAG